MLKLHPPRRDRLLFLVGGLLGAAAFLLVFGLSSLDVTNDAFCRGGFIEKDIQQHYAGWLFYRQSALRFPLCIAESVNWPDGLSVAYTDSIPLLAVLGKLLGPGLLLLILAVFVGCLLHPQGAAGTAMGDYAQGAAVTGFLEGYQTMDTIAALNFGFIIALNVRAKGVSEQKHVVGETCLAGVLAGVVLLAVYSALAYIGVQYSAAFQGAQNGTEVLRSMVQALFGPVGSVLLALIFAIACLNTCIGLISCCSDYFAKIFPFWGYRVWAVFFAVISMLISNIGLNQILAVSVPVLGAIYPIAIVLIALAFLHTLIGRFRLVYPAAILLTGIVSIVAALDGIGLAVPGLSQLIRHLPFYADQLGWLLPAVLGIAIGIVLSAMRPQSGWKKDVS